MEQSILKSVKKILNVDPLDTTFDLDILTHINTAFSTLSELGIGPVLGFEVLDDTKLWGAYIGPDPKLNQIKTYVCLKTRMAFDPPTTSYLIGAFEKQIQELEWRINTNREATAWVDPDPPSLGGDDVFGDLLIVDGGGV